MSLFSMLAASLISIVALTILLALVGKVPINLNNCLGFLPDL